MTEKTNDSLYSEQNKASLKLEDAITDYLNDDMRINALDFTAYCRATKVVLRQTVENFWGLIYKNEDIGSIWLSSDSWFIVPNADYSGDWENLIRNEGLVEIVWANVQPCGNCSSCAPGKNMTILGKEFTNVCTCICLFRNPDTATVNCIKKIIEHRKNLITTL